MAYANTYGTKISNLLGQMADSKYASKYENQIEDTANRIANYGSYNSQYQPQIDDLTDRIANYGDYSGTYADQIGSLADRIANWNYDPEADASYQAYKKQYTDLGNTAMRNTLAQTAARTGGMASSYSATAAAQQYNNYMQQLSNLIPQLEQNAWNRTSNTLNTLNNLDATEYGRWNDALTRLYNQQNMYQNLDQTAYGRWNDALNELYNRNNMYINMDQNDLDHWTKNWSMMQDLLANYRDADALEYDRYLDELAQASKGSGGSGGSGGGGGGYYYEPTYEEPKQTVNTKTTSQKPKDRSLTANSTGSNSNTTLLNKLIRMTK